MHMPSAAVATALAGAALGLSASPAAADPGQAGPSNIVVTPRTVAQGAALTVTVAGATCRGTGRPYDAIVESNAFPRTALKGVRGEASATARPRVFAAVRPGTHTVSATCGGRTVTGGKFRVVPRRGTDASAASGAAQDRRAAGRPAREEDGGAVPHNGPEFPQRGYGLASAAPTAERSDPAIPHHPVRGGAGGGAQQVSPVLTGVGVGLVAASAAACGYALLRRRPPDPR
ncbi:hypothetical protein AB0C51_19215 [Streptomyces pathocidini]|uniref:hypothetical protein n=1 Tax=Streptomyces pathocidini TaxID=1650571 RepID=UPI0033C48B56